MDEQVKILFLPEPPFPFYSVFCKNTKGRMLAGKYDAAMREMGFTSDRYIKLIQHEFDLLDQKPPHPRK